MGSIDPSDLCCRCNQLFTFREIIRYREECNGGDDSGMPQYCDECLDELHVLEGSALSVPDDMWKSGMFWLPSTRPVREEKLDDRR